MQLPFREERKEAIKTLVKCILPSDMFGQIEYETLEYLVAWTSEGSTAVGTPHPAALLNQQQERDGVRWLPIKLEQIIQNPLVPTPHFYLCGDSCQSFAE